MKQKDFLIQIIEEALEKVEVEWQSKEPVSYTHLNSLSYKNRTGCSFRFQVLEERNRDSGSICCGTVSYTHLDVYKRQGKIYEKCL